MYRLKSSKQVYDSDVLDFDKSNCRHIKKFIYNSQLRCVYAMRLCTARKLRTERIINYVRSFFQQARKSYMETHYKRSMASSVNNVQYSTSHVTYLEYGTLAGIWYLLPASKPSMGRGVGGVKP